MEFGATNAEIQLTIGGIDTAFSGTSYGIATGQGDEITIRQRNLLSNRLTLGTIAAAAPLVIAAFPSVSGGQDIGDSLTIDGNEELSWDGVTVQATTQEARLLVDGTPRAAGDLTLPAGSGGQNCEVQVRFGYDTAAGLSISTDWNTIPGESFTILDPPPPEPFDLTIEGLELVLSGGPSMTTLTVIAPPAYAGTYPIDPTDLTAGPMPLVAPQITGDGSPAIGEALTSTPGLWAYDGDLTEPTISYVWQRNATPIPGATGNSYVLQAGDEGTDITLRETATDTNGTRSIVSAVIRPEATGTAWGAPSLIAVGNGQADIQSGANRPTTPTIPTISDIGDGSVVLSGA